MKVRATLLSCCLIVCINEQSAARSKFSSECVTRAGLRRRVTRDGSVASDTRNSEFNPSTGDVSNSFGSIFICHYLLKTTKTFQKRKLSNSAKVLSNRGKNLSISEEITYISGNVYAKNMKIFKIQKENIVYKNNTESIFGISHDKYFPASINSDVAKTEGKKSVKTLTKSVIIFCVITSETNAVSSTNRCAELEIITGILDRNIGECMESSYTASSSACWPACMKSPTVVCVPALLPNRTWPRFCNPMKRYSHGYCYFLQRLQPEGKFLSYLLIVCDT